MTDRRILRVAVVGAGLSGLTAAWTLRAAGMDVRVFEKSGQAGGRTLSVRKSGFVFDVGAITMLPTYTNTVALAQELGIGLHRVIPVIGIPRGGTTHRLDLERPLISLLSTKLLSAGAKLRLLRLIPALVAAWPRANFQSLAGLAAWDGETVADRVGRLCGAEVLDYVAGPIIRGNTLNSPNHAPFGELLWMLRQYSAPFLFGFEGGINVLAETLARNLPVSFNTRIDRIETTASRVTVHGPDDAYPESFDGCVVALPPKDLLALAPPLSARQRALLDDIKPLPSVSLHVGLSRRPAATETFILPPEPEHKTLTTIVLDHLKAPGRAPTGKGAMSFFVSDEWSAANFDRPDEDIRAAILGMARPFVGDVSPDIEACVVQRWPYAIIKSEIGLYGRIRDFQADTDSAARIQLSGDFLSMGMEAAISSGMTAAGNLVARFASQPLKPGNHGDERQCPTPQPLRHGILQTH